MADLEGPQASQPEAPQRDAPAEPDPILLEAIDSLNSKVDALRNQLKLDGARLEKMIDAVAEPIGDFNQEIERQSRSIKQYGERIEKTFEDIQKRTEKHLEFVKIKQAGFEKKLGDLQASLDTTKKKALSESEKLPALEKRLQK